MKYRVSNQGFAIVETLLVLVIIGALGFMGWYVYHASNQTNLTLNKATTNSAPISSTTKTTTKSLSIKEWGVQASYTAAPTLSYSINNNGGTPPIYTASITSTQLLILDKTGCVSGGGIIERAYANTTLDEGGRTPTSKGQSYTTKKIGNYYYVYIPNQGPCSNNQTLVNQTEKAAESLVTNLTPIQ